MKNKISTVYTHAGIFHADEVFACAVLALLNPSPMFNIIRVPHANKKLIEKMKEQSGIAVVDIGGEYNPSKNNYDHHQDKHMPSSAYLIWQHFGVELCGSKECAKILERNFVNFIDAWDVNRHRVINEIDVPAHSASSVVTPTTAMVANYNRVPHVSRLIAGFNRDPKNNDNNFFTAVSLMQQLIKNEIRTAECEIEEERVFLEGEFRDTGSGVTSKVFDAYCRIWKNHDYIKFAVMPAVEQGVWQVLSSDSSQFPITEEACESEELVYRHEAEFLAKFSSKEAALECLKRL